MISYKSTSKRIPVGGLRSRTPVVCERCVVTVVKYLREYFLK